jgi:hypothetical protein
MVEAVAAWNETFGDAGTPRTRAVTFSPGFRTGWNGGERQTIVGFAVPMTASSGALDVGVFGYASYELPFRAPQP